MAEITILYLYQKYKKDVYAYLISLTHDIALAEDLTSETFLGAISSLSRYKGDADIKTWLFSIARFKWYEYIRKNKLKFADNALLDIYIADEINIEKTLTNNLIVDRIHQLLNLENDKNKGVFLMRAEGYSFYEIALKYNISESSARVIDFRLKTKLKEILKKEGYGYE